MKRQQPTETTILPPSEERPNTPTATKSTPLIARIQQILKDYSLALYDTLTGTGHEPLLAWHAQSGNEQLEALQGYWNDRNKLKHVSHVQYTCDSVARARKLLREVHLLEKGLLASIPPYTPLQRPRTEEPYTEEDLEELTISDILIEERLRESQPEPETPRAEAEPKEKPQERPLQEADIVIKASKSLDYEGPWLFYTFQAASNDEVIDRLEHATYYRPKDALKKLFGTLDGEIDELAKTLGTPRIITISRTGEKTSYYPPPLIWALEDHVKGPRKSPAPDPEELLDVFEERFAKHSATTQKYYAKLINFITEHKEPTISELEKNQAHKYLRENFHAQVTPLKEILKYFNDTRQEREQRKTRSLIEAYERRNLTKSKLYRHSRA